jgi:hypothetical protein
MKVKIEAGAVIMAPECADDHAAIHQMGVCGVKATHMLNSSAEVFGQGLRGPLVVETYPERHDLPGSRNAAA